ncbi:MAG: cell division protein SepF [Aquiluna sp.]|jgi:cell division inhibitor SepF|nr:cell division protein SepF [Aquiluna sp.]MDP5026292.1 cell division protein SepF [Aquiluna sp.]
MGVANSVMSFFGFGSSESETTQTPKPRASAPRPRRSSDMSEIVTLDPQSYADAKEVAANFRAGVPVIVNIGAMSESDAKRMLDFMIGLKEGLEGHLRRVTPKVFLLSPTNVAVTDADNDQDDPEDLMA